MHTGLTKVLFHPNDPTTFFVLYQEFHIENFGAHLPSGATQFYTYLRRFHYNGSPILEASERLEIFNVDNSADFVVAPDGSVIISGVMDQGRVKLRVVKNMAFLRYGAVFGPSSLNISTEHAARRQYLSTGSALWNLGMDMKGDRFVVAHTTGTGSQFSLNGKAVRVLRFDFNSVGGVYFLTDQSEVLVDKKILNYQYWTPRSVGLRSNGEALFLSKVVNGPAPAKYELVKIDAAGSATPSYIFTEAPSAKHMVVSEEDEVFVSGVVDGEHAIGLFNAYNTFEHLYDVDSDLDNPIDDLAIDHCTLVASGHLVNTPSHQFFACSDCDGSAPKARMTLHGYQSLATMPTYYGQKDVARYCNKKDIVIDGSASSCEQSYFIGIYKINPSTWAITGTVFYEWISIGSEAPSNIQLSDHLPAGTYFDPNATYLMILGVGNSLGGSVNTTQALFTVSTKYCKSKPKSGVNDAVNEKVLDVSVYPNPTQGQLTLSANQTNDSHTYTITNMMGQIIQSGTFVGSEKLDLAANPAGILFDYHSKWSPQYNSKNHFKIAFNVFARLASCKMYALGQVPLISK